MVRTHDQKRPCIPEIHCAFPSERALRLFIEEDASISSGSIECFIAYAKGRGAISGANQNDFIQLIRNCEACDAKPHCVMCDFSVLLQEAAGGESVNSLVGWLNRLGAQLAMPVFSAPMITRLKKEGMFNTPKQRALLRILLMFVATRRGDCIYTFDQFVTGGRGECEKVKKEEERNGTLDMELLSVDQKSISIDLGMVM